MEKHVIACLEGYRMADHIADAAAWVSSTIHVPLRLVHVLENGGKETQPDDRKRQPPLSHDEGVALLDSVQSRLNDAMKAMCGNK